MAAVLARRLAAASTAAVLVACGGGPGAPPDHDEDVEPEAPDVADAEAQDAGEPDGDAPLPEPEDGVVRALGVVLPIPEGWALDRSLFDDGILGANPSGSEPDQLLIAAAGIERTDTFGVGGADLDGAVEHFRQLMPVEPSTDEAIEVAGAARAHLLRFDDLELEPGAERSHEVVIVADDGGGELAIFNYAATASGLDEGVLEEVVDGIGLDPDSEPASITDPTTSS